MRGQWFDDITRIGKNEVSFAYEIEKRKSSVKMDRDYQTGIAVYQYAKKRMLEFY